MQQFARFSFYGNLNDFLFKKDKNKRITYSFNGTPAVKDAIEAIGIPHVEVEWILINATPAWFYTPLLSGSFVEVFPLDTPPAQANVHPVRAGNQMPGGFVLDTHLGALARLLRMLGMDTSYSSSYSDSDLAQISSAENRVVLTRDISLLKQKIIVWGYWLRSQQPQEQLMEVIKRYRLTHSFKPFTRCHCCNGFIRPVDKGSVVEQLPSGIKEHYTDFFQCEGCRKVYWKGTHYERMVQFIRALRAQL